MREVNFVSALTDYLQTYSFNSAQTPQLLDKFNAYSDKNMTRLIETWVYQAGFPVLNVEKLGENQYMLTQERYLAHPQETYNPDDSPFG